MKLYKVYAGESKDQTNFCMTAPLGVIARVFRLHLEALKRIERETIERGYCQIYTNTKFELTFGRCILVEKGG